MNFARLADLAAAQFSQNGSIAYDQFEQIALEPSFAAVWSKSVLKPQSLTPAEYRMLDSYLAIRTTIWERAYDIEQAGYTPKGETESSMRRYGGIYFGNSFAKAWWAEERLRCGTGDFCGLLDRVLVDVGSDENDKWIKNIQDALAAESSKALEK